MALKIGGLWEDLSIPGIAAGVGAIVLAPVLIPAAAKASKPLAKAIIKGGIIAYTKTKSAIAETGEVIEDLLAEVQAELAEEEELAESDLEAN
ncbi:MAG: DUF5132 domain-containing protein [Cyanobacteria bacterium J083]|nr:MAG: DUF5132 domain-containing protein [Cyanobacteria bacterium J083]